MKNTLLINHLVVQLFFLLSLNLFAQESKKDEGIKFGVKSGLNVSNFINSDNVNESSKFGYHLGLISEIILSNNSSIQPELVYSSQGIIQNGLKSKFEYINIPLILRIYPNKNFSIDGGPQFGFLTNSYSKTNSGNININSQNVFDLALCIGATYDFKNNFFFQSRYNLGLININNSDSFKYQNSVMQFTVGYYF
jgi:hypothetical protein